jgi:hypothetical protein
MNLDLGSEILSLVAVTALAICAGVRSGSHREHQSATLHEVAVLDRRHGIIDGDSVPGN